jgi:ABC-type transporter Mla MlaB component
MPPDTQGVAANISLARRLHLKTPNSRRFTQNSIGHFHRDSIALLKITTLYPDKGHCLLRLEGRLACIWLEELQRRCAKELARARQLRLDMAGVQYVDQTVKSFLWELIGTDIASGNRPPFVAEQLRPRK